VAFRVLWSGLIRSWLKRPGRVGILLAIALSVSCGGSPTAPTTTAAAPSSSYSESSFREAARITAAAASAAFDRVHAGLYERDVKAIVDSVFAQLGSGPPAFASIVAAGSHGFDFHYAGDDGLLVDGDLVVIDIGATSNGHCADLTRTYPVSGRFTARQRELYQLVLDVQTVAAGANTQFDSLYSLDAYARQQFRASPLRARDSMGREQTMDTFFTHSLGHFIGREVHGSDTGLSVRDVLRAGAAVAIEPGLYIPSEGIAIRVEDTFLVGSQRLTCLSCDAPKLAEAIER
jgi:Xaa-Pro aminopeptidase